jgi:peptidoglycan/xylan/chitin deacetylase (PgdA/CDA1 family)
VQQVKPGAIVLLHDTNPHTVAAIQKALPELKTKYQLVTVSELMGLSGGDQGQYFGR